MADKRFKKSHIHKYQKRTFPSGKIYFACVIPGCSHYRHDWDIAGRDAQCWYCEKTFKVTQQQISSGTARPHCFGCYSPRGFGRKKHLEQVKERVELTRSTDRHFATDILDNVLKEHLQKEKTKELQSEEEQTNEEQVIQVEENDNTEEQVS